MKLFTGGYISRESCADCRFKGFNRISDLTIGDFWGIWDIAPEMDNDCGTSVVLCQSDRGAKLLNAIFERLVLKRVTLEDASCQNSSMLTSAPAHPRRKEALNVIRTGNINICESWFQSHRVTIGQRLWHIVQKVLGK